MNCGACLCHHGPDMGGPIEILLDEDAQVPYTGACGYDVLSMGRIMEAQLCNVHP